MKMKDYQSNSHNNFEDDTIDYIALLKKILSNRELIIKSIISFFIIGCLVALLSPVIYTSQTTFVPQVSGYEMSPSKSQLGSLATLAGITINPTKMTGDSYLSPYVYTNIINSEEFSLKLLNEELVNSNADKFTVKEYLLSEKSSFDFDPIGFVKKYTIGLFLSDETKEIKSDILKNYNFISEKDYNLIQSFRSKFEIELNDKDGSIKVFATDKNPFLSSQIVKIVTKKAQTKIIEI